MFSTIDPQHTSKLMINYQKQSHYSQDQARMPIISATFQYCTEGLLVEKDKKKRK